MEQLSTLQNDVSTNCVGLTALGSEAYAIGGNVDRVTLRYPKRVYTYNFNKHSKQQWEEGPTLNGGKPDPVVVTLDHKIYALARISFWGDTTSEKLDPVFEFLILMGAMFGPVCLIPHSSPCTQYKIVILMAWSSVDTQSLASIFMCK